MLPSLSLVLVRKCESTEKTSGTRARSSVKPRPTARSLVISEPLTRIFRRRSARIMDNSRMLGTFRTGTRLVLPAARHREDRPEDVGHRVRIDPRRGRPVLAGCQELGLAVSVEDRRAESGLRLGRAPRQLHALAEQPNDLGVDRVDVIARLFELGRALAEVRDREGGGLAAAIVLLAAPGGFSVEGSVDRGQSAHELLAR